MVWWRTNLLFNTQNVNSGQKIWCLEYVGALSSLKFSWKKNLNLGKTLKRNIKCFWICIKSEKTFLQLLGWQSEVATSSGSNPEFNFFHRELWWAMTSIKCLFATSQLLAPPVGNLCIFNDLYTPLIVSGHATIFDQSQCWNSGVS